MKITQDPHHLRLTETVKSAGCASKLPPGDLDKVLCGMVFPTNTNVLIGGHSIEDSELKYGLSVTGFIHPGRILTKKTIRSGDRLILTKPLGTGIINTAIKGGLAASSVIESTIRLMATLNRRAAEIMSYYAVSACTDITGFGLLGHLAEMVAGSGFGMTIHASNIPIIPEAREYAAMGLVPAGAHKNREFREIMVTFGPRVDRVMRDICFDPQTSGGLLISIPGAHADALLARLKEENCISRAEIIGEVTGVSEHITIL